MKSTVFAAVAVALSWAIPAHASPQLRSLFAAIQATGTSVVIDHPQKCSDPSLMGQYSYQPRVIDEYLICVGNHKGDNAELYDTVLHEAVHVAQACKGGPIYSAESIIKAAEPKDIQLVGAGYPNHQFNVELEARVLARQQDEVFVTTLIKQHCK